MPMPKHTKWEKEAFNSAFYTTIFALVVMLIIEGINWLFTGRFNGKVIAGTLAIFFCAMYFKDAIDGIYKRIDEIEAVLSRRASE
jgi:hypothetical protein